MEPTRDEILKHAVQRLNSGAVAEAEFLCREVLARAPDNVEALNVLSACAKKSGNMMAAIEYARRAAAAHPTIAESHANLGQLLHEAGKVDESIVTFDRAIKLDASNAAFHFGIALVFNASRQYDRAAAALRRAVEIKPHAAAYSTLSAMLRQLGRFEDAISAARSALALDPKAATAKAIKPSRPISSASTSKVPTRNPHRLHQPKPHGRSPLRSSPQRPPRRNDGPHPRSVSI